MAVLNKFNSFIEALAEKTHNLGTDTLTVALSNTSPVNTNSVLADIAQISYTNLSSRVVTTVSSAQTAGTYKLTLADLVLTASGPVATFQYVILYNSSALSLELISWGDYGSPITLANTETFTIDFDNVGGALTITPV